MAAFLGFILTFLSIFSTGLILHRIKFYQYLLVISGLDISCPISIVYNCHDVAYISVPRDVFPQRWENKGNKNISWKSCANMHVCVLATENMNFRLPVLCVSSRVGLEMSTLTLWNLVPAQMNWIRICMLIGPPVVCMHIRTWETLINVISLEMWRNRKGIHRNNAINLASTGLFKCIYEYFLSMLSS